MSTIGNRNFLPFILLAIIFSGQSSASGQEYDQFKGVIGRTFRDSKPYYPPQVRPKAGSPNIVYIVLDDTGFSDFGSFGSEVSTPNIDFLANHGLRYNNFHTEAICSASRAALLTGRNSHTVGMGNLANVADGFPSHRGEITHAAATLAEMLQSSGYNTYAVGKWHLLPLEKSSTTGPMDQWPVQRGFDRYYGFLGGWTDQYHPDLMQDNSPIDIPNRPGYRLSVDLVDHAIDYIHTQASVAPTTPFFLYLAFGATHAPHQAPKDLIDKYVPIFSKGWDQTRLDRLARQKQMGLVPENTELTEHNPGVLPWDQLNADEKAVFTRYQAAYAGFLEDADTQIGRVIETLRQIGQLDNTVIVVLSDNGASREGDATGTMNEWFQITNLKRDRAPVSQQLALVDQIGTERTFGNYPMGWAMAGNTPFKYYKSSVWGGGERDPLIVSWPKSIKDSGKIRGQFIDIIDITPTILALVGVKAPAEYHGIKQIPLAGKSFASTFSDAKAPNPRNVQYFEIWGQRALWRDGWKAVSTHSVGADFDKDQWTLYDLSKDFSEANDLAGANPQKLHELEDLWWTEAKRYGVLPLDDRTVIDPAFNGGGQTSPSEYLYYPGQYRVGYGSDPNVLDRSYSITAYVNRSDANTQGVLLAEGDRFGGYVLFVKDQQLVFDQNDFGKHTIMRSDSALPIGHSVVRYEFSKTGKFSGIGKLSIDGHVVAEAPIATTPTLSITWNGLSVGRDGLSPISEEYAGLGSFTFPAGELDKVVVNLK